MATDMSAKILVLGKSQAGKSSFINYFLDTDSAKIGKGKPETKGYCIEYQYNGGKYPIKIYDNQGFETAIANQQKGKIIDFVREHNNSDDVLNWFHTIFYCTSARSRFEDFEADFILDLNKSISQNIHIILTTCDGLSKSELKAKKDFIRGKLKSLGDKCHIFEVVSISKKKLNGEIVKPYGKEAISESVFELLWDDICSKISFEYAKEVDYDLKSIVYDVKKEMNNLLDEILTIKGLIAFSQDELSFDSRFDEMTPRFERAIERNNEKYQSILQPIFQLYSSYSGVVLNVDVNTVQLNLESMFPDVFDFDSDDLLNKHFPAMSKIMNNSTKFGDIMRAGFEFLTLKKRFKSALDDVFSATISSLPSVNELQQNAYDELMTFGDFIDINSNTVTSKSVTISEEEFWDIINTLSDEEDFEFSKTYAEKGYHFAEWSLGNDYRDGVGVAQDESQAAFWYEKAAEQGYAIAQVDLANICLENHDGKKAVYWYRKAAEQNYPDGQWSLGQCYYNGIGVEKDLALAVDWFKKAAESDLDCAMCDLAECYYNGTGVEEDDELALYWYNKAAEMDNGAAMCGLADYFSTSQEEAFKLYKKAAELGYDEGMFELAECYYNGYGVAVNHEKALYWYNKAAEEGNENALQELAKF